MKVAILDNTLFFHVQLPHGGKCPKCRDDITPIDYCWVSNNALVYCLNCMTDSIIIQEAQDKVRKCEKKVGKLKCPQCYDTGIVLAMGGFDNDKRCSNGCPVK